ncbi:MAG: beta-ketoacyl-ACP synthase III [Clostridiales bacterium]|nr:beta-ketoacyl-ACP synthase III [Clostridiales bacterium]
MAESINMAASGILGTGSSIPEKILTNADLEKMVETSDDWITKRTGIKERHILEKNQPAYKMAAEASRKAVADAGLAASDIELIIFATVTPDYLTPSMASIIQNEIGAVNAATFDLNAACSGFVYGMVTASQFIRCGTYKYILVVGCEALSKVTDWQDRNTCILFGDGAGAVVMGTVQEGFGLLSWKLGSDGRMGRNITIPCMYINEEDKLFRTHSKEQVVWMDGSEVFKFAVRIMAQTTEEVLSGTGISLNDLRLIIPHQANIRIIDGAIKRLGIEASKVYVNVPRYGNTGAASLAVALDEAASGGMIEKGDYFVLVGFGGGLTWASSLIRWAK